MAVCTIRNTSKHEGGKNMESFKVLTKQEIKAITADNIKPDVALKEHMDKLKYLIDALSGEFEAYKTVLKEIFGDDGGNKVFRTESRTDYIMNTEALIELIGEEKYKALKNKPSKKVYVKW